MLMQGISSSGGPFDGVPAPPFQAGKLYWPHFLIGDSRKITLTANRLYQTWIYVQDTTTFLGGWCFNGGASDSGVVLRIGVWSATGALEKDFGVITLTSSAIINQAANTVTLKKGWHRIAMVSSGTPSMMGFGIASYLSSVGAMALNTLAGQLGAFSISPSGGTPFPNTPVGDYASFAYAALPDPITTMTTTIMDSASTTVANIPMMGLYL